MTNQFNASLWGDEAFSAVLSTNSPTEIIKIIIRDTSPPLYNLTLHFWYKIFGVSEVSIRLLSFLYFVACLFFIYLIGKLIWDNKTGIVVALLSFLNPFFFTYAFEGRMYSILSLGVVASIYFFLKIISEKNKKTKGDITIVAYTLSLDWALYSHHFAIFSIVPQVFWTFIEFLKGNKTGATRVIKGMILAALLYLPWIYPLYKQATMVASGFWLGKPTFVDLRNLIYEYLAEGIKNPSVKIPFINKELGNISLYMVIAAFLLRKWNIDIKKSLFFLSWFLVPIIVTWLVSQKMQSIFFNRYLLYTIPAAMILLGSNRRRVSNLILILIIICFVIIDFNYFIHPTKRPFRELSSYLKSETKQETFLINWNSSAHHLWESKFYGIDAPIYNPSGELPYYVGTAQMKSEDIIKEIPRNFQKIGAITSGPVEEVKIKNYKATSHKSFGDLKVVWLEKTN